MVVGRGKERRREWVDGNTCGRRFGNKEAVKEGEEEEVTDKKSTALMHIFKLCGCQ